MSVQSMYRKRDKKTFLPAHLCGPGRRDWRKVGQGQNFHLISKPTGRNKPTPTERKGIRLIKSNLKVCFDSFIRAGRVLFQSGRKDFGRLKQSSLDAKGASKGIAQEMGHIFHLLFAPGWWASCARVTRREEG